MARGSSGSVEVGSSRDGCRFDRFRVRFSPFKSSLPISGMAPPGVPIQDLKNWLGGSSGSLEVGSSPDGCQFDRFRVRFYPFKSSLPISEMSRLGIPFRDFRGHLWWFNGFTGSSAGIREVLRLVFSIRLGIFRGGSFGCLSALSLKFFGGALSLIYE